MKEIIFYPSSKLVEEVVPAPKKVEIPDWYKKIPSYEDISGVPKGTMIVENNDINTTAKTCMPFLDSFTSGYTFNLWADIQIRQVNGGPRITWLHKEEELRQVESRSVPSHMPVPVGFEPLIFSWWSHWGIKTPKGYSCLFTHPLNRSDLPFITTSGIMDTDEWGIWGNQPFYLQKGFEGVIPAGTPIIHVLPFKRDDWRGVQDKTGKLMEWANYEKTRQNSKFRGYYKNKYWKKKNYQ